MTTRLIDKWIAEKLGWVDVRLGSEDIRLEPRAWRWHSDYMQDVLVGTKDGERQPIPDYSYDADLLMPEVLRLTAEKNLRGIRFLMHPIAGLMLRVGGYHIPGHTAAECLAEAFTRLADIEHSVRYLDYNGNWIEVSE